jgi:transposase
MEAPLSNCTNEEMRRVIRFLFAEGVKPVEIILRMQAQYSDNCLTRSKIYEWIDHFKKGRTSVCDEERSGRPSASRTENSIQAVEGIVRENKRITVDDSAEALNISHGSAYSNLLYEEEDFRPMKKSLARCKIG